jgi:hypothetical protein
MKYRAIVAVLALLAAGGSGWAQTAPDLKGAWVEVGEGGNLVRRGGPFEHADPAGAEAVFGDPRKWTLKVVRQEGGMFAGTWESEARADPMVGVVSADGKTLHMADDNGALLGTLRSDNEMEICRALADPTRMLASCWIFARTPQ